MSMSTSNTNTTSNNDHRRGLQHNNQIHKPGSSNIINHHNHHHPQLLTQQLLDALDHQYNVIDARTVNEIFSILENFNITKELLETTRLGKHVNELRRKTNDPDLAKRAKQLVKRWRGLVIPDKTVSNDNSVVSRPVLQQKRQPLASPTIHNVSPAFQSLSPGQLHPFVPHSKSSLTPEKKNFSKSRSPAFSLQREPVKIDIDHDSDSQDVILVDDDDPPVITLPGDDDPPPIETHASKRAHSPYNGDSIFSEEDSLRRVSKKARRESSGRKAKKRRNEKSENSTIDHSLDAVKLQSPFMPISSASTSPNLIANSMMKNGLSQPVLSPGEPISLLDDLESKSPAPLMENKNKSRKNGCKKPSIDIEEYSTFIKNKIPTSGKKVKTTKELLEEIQARTAGKIMSPVKMKESGPKADFLSVYDSKKQIKAEAVITDIIELNDSNSMSGKEDESKVPLTAGCKVENKDATQETVKFESLEVILAKLPPFNMKNVPMDDECLPECTCSIIYNNQSEDEHFSEEAPKPSIFSLDKPADESTVAIPAEPLFEEQIDPDCPAASFYKKHNSKRITGQMYTLHNYFIPNVNGNVYQKALEAKRPICKIDEWGHRPYFDCEKNLFLDVVPKYNYMDYSSDKCFKNFSKISLDKYEPAELMPDSSVWFEQLEKERKEKFRVPTPEPCKDEIQSESVEPKDECESDSDKKEESEMHSDSVLETNDIPPEEVVVKKPKKIFTFEDSVSLLPLSLSALNNSSNELINNDLSCVFRTKQSSEKDDLTYDLVEDATVVEMKDLTDGAAERLKRERWKSSSFLGEVNDNANCDSDIKRAETQSAFNDNSSLETCVKGGCPKWVSPGDSSFREWHEPVVRFSLNEEPLTVLPYVIID